jgi:hypothetical protein
VSFDISSVLSLLVATCPSFPCFVPTRLCYFPNPSLQRLLWLQWHQAVGPDKFCDLSLARSIHRETMALKRTCAQRAQRGRRLMPAPSPLPHAISLKL